MVSLTAGSIINPGQAVHFGCSGSHKSAFNGVVPWHVDTRGGRSTDVRDDTGFRSTNAISLPTGHDSEV